jgi:hypothetical protein
MISRFKCSPSCHQHSDHLHMPPMASAVKESLKTLSLMISDHGLHSHHFEIQKKLRLPRELRSPLNGLVHKQHAEESILSTKTQTHSRTALT